MALPEGVPPRMGKPLVSAPAPSARRALPKSPRAAASRMTTEVDLFHMRATSSAVRFSKSRTNRSSCGCACRSVMTWALSLHAAKCKGVQPSCLKTEKIGAMVYTGLKQAVVIYPP